MTTPSAWLDKGNTTTPWLSKENTTTPWLAEGETPPVPFSGDQLHLVVDWTGVGRGDADASNLYPTALANITDHGGGLKGDITPWVRQLDCRLGRDAGDPLAHQDEGGHLTALLDNRDGLFDPFAWRGDPDSKPLPRRVVILWQPVGDGDWRAVWGGYLTDLLPEWEGPPGAGRAQSRLIVEGPLASLARRAEPLALDVSLFPAHPQAGEVIEAVLDTVNWPEHASHLDSGSFALNAGQLAKLGIIGLLDALVQPVRIMGQVSAADGGILYGDQLARIVYEQPLTRAKRLDSVLPTLTDAHGPVAVRNVGYLDGLYNIFEPDVANETLDLVFNTATINSEPVTLRPSETATFVVNAVTILADDPARDRAFLSAVGTIFVGLTPDVDIDSSAVVSIPNVIVTVTISGTATDRDYSVRITTLEYKARRVDRAAVLISARNQEAIAAYGPSPYHFPGRVYHAGTDNIALLQAWLDWLAAEYSQPRQRARLAFRVSATLGNASLLGLSIGDMVNVDVTQVTMPQAVIEGVHLTWVAGQPDIGIEWNITDASPYLTFPK